jgi:hypothetical protein
MSNVWLTIPSKRPVEEAEPVLKAWRERGYKIALFVDWNPPGSPLSTRKVCGDFMMCGGGQYQPQFDPETRIPVDPKDRTYLPHFNDYPGYAMACNALIIEVMKQDPGAEWFVCGGDDVLPDPNHSAEEIAIECKCHFYTNKAATREERMATETFGVMQPTGDRWGIDPNTHAFESLTPGCDSCACKVCGRGEIAPVHLTGAYIDRVAGSPWIGREFARRMYQGRGPYWPEYTHMGVDEEIRAVAIKYGVYWERPDLTHFHQHWGRPREGETIGQQDRMPEFLKQANSAGEWKRYKRIFAERKAMGFPGSEPL